MYLEHKFIDVILLAKAISYFEELQHNNSEFSFEGITFLFKKFITLLGTNNLLLVKIEIPMRWVIEGVRG